MNQKRIGEFISKLRKEKEMTQVELANHLGVTDRAISKWENGRGLPDLSLIRELCDILGISINELLNGEKIKKEEYKKVSDNNLINTLEYGKQELKKRNKVSILIISILMLITLTLLTLFMIDTHRMRNDLPVFFSTWGLDYYPPINLDEEKITIAIEEYIVNTNDSESSHYNDEKYFTSIEKFLIKELKENSIYEVYTWVLSESFYRKDNEVINDGSYSVPIKFTVKKEDNNYIVTNEEYPNDFKYEEDIKRIFPKSIINKIKSVNRDGTIEKLALEIQKQVKLYFHE